MTGNAWCHDDHLGAESRRIDVRAARASNFDTSTTLHERRSASGGVASAARLSRISIIEAQCPAAAAACRPRRRGRAGLLAFPAASPASLCRRERRRRGEEDEVWWREWPSMIIKSSIERDGRRGGRIVSWLALRSRATPRQKARQPVVYRAYGNVLVHGGAWW